MDMQFAIVDKVKRIAGGYDNENWGTYTSTVLHRHERGDRRRATSLFGEDQKGLEGH